MKIYQPDAPNGRRTTFVQPGAEFPNSDFLDAHGKPRMFSVEFVHGVAEVPDNLGAYMLDKELAFRSPIILPMGARA